jgi:SAM-dependent methyltransferase
VIGARASATATRLARHCICCNADSRDVIYRNHIAPIDDRDLSYDVVECQVCGAAFADALAPPEDYATYYRCCSKYDLHTTVSDVPPVDRRRAEFATGFVREHSRAPQSVFDIGCGSGTLLAEFVRSGCRVANGIDPAPNAAASARHLYGLDGIRQGTMSEIGGHDALRDFDVVCMTGVLEHLTNPAESLRGLMDEMRPDATLLVEVPALERFSRTALEPYGEFSIEHLNFFSRCSLFGTARRAGLRPVASAIVDLWPAATDSLYALFTRGAAKAEPRDGAELLRSYVELSQVALQPVLQRVASALDAHGAVIWGAGSHSARLLPVLAGMGLDRSVRAVIDSNPNLHGRGFGRYTVMPPEALRDWPDATVIISSFRASAAIARSLRARFTNAVCTLYPDSRDPS